MLVGVRGMLGMMGMLGIIVMMSNKGKMRMDGRVSLSKQISAETLHRIPDTYTSETCCFVTHAYFYR